MYRQVILLENIFLQILPLAVQMMRRTKFQRQRLVEIAGVSQCDVQWLNYWHTEFTGIRKLFNLGDKKVVPTVLRPASGKVC